MVWPTTSVRLYLPRITGGNKSSVELSDRSTAAPLIPAEFYPFDALLKELRQQLDGANEISRQLSEDSHSRWQVPESCSAIWFGRPSGAFHTLSKLIPPNGCHERKTVLVPVKTGFSPIGLKVG